VQCLYKLVKQFYIEVEDRRIACEGGRTTWQRR